MLECMQQQDVYGFACFILACLKVYLAKRNAVPT